MVPEPKGRYALDVADRTVTAIRRVSMAQSYCTGQAGRTRCSCAGACARTCRPPRRHSCGPVRLPCHEVSATLTFTAATATHGSGQGLPAGGRRCEGQRPWAELPGERPPRLRAPIESSVSRASCAFAAAWRRPGSGVWRPNGAMSAAANLARRRSARLTRAGGERRRELLRGRDTEHLTSRKHPWYIPWACSSSGGSADQSAARRPPGRGKKVGSGRAPVSPIHLSARAGIR